MTPADFLNLILQLDMARIVRTGGQWEIWLHNEIAAMLLDHYGTSCRERKYSGTQQSVDILFQLKEEIYAVEIKVQSGGHRGQFAGMSLKDAIAQDVAKIKTLDGVHHRWVVAIAYASEAKTQLEGLGAFFSVTDTEGQFMAVLIDADQWSKRLTVMWNWQ
jgi:hypothetical protein